MDAEADTAEHHGQVDNNNNNSDDDDFINVGDVLRSLQESARETAESEGII